MSNPLPRVGLVVAGMFPLDALTVAREADAAGLYAIGVGDSVHETFSMLGAISSVTHRIRLVSSIATWTRTPVTTARAARMMDILSGGRYTLGVGSMSADWNEAFHDIPYKSPLRRLREYVEVIRLLLDATPDTPVNYQGQFYRVSNYVVPEPPPPRPIPILIGATRPKAVRLAGEIADGVIFNWSNSHILWLQDVGLPALAEGARQAGRSPNDLKRVAPKWVVVTDKPEQARAAVRQTIGPYFRRDYHRDMLYSQGYGEVVDAALPALAAGDRSGAAQAVTDDMVDTFAVIGPADECRDRVAQLASLVDWVWLITPPPLPRAERLRATLRLIETFGSG